MILVADSGSSKTDWRLISENEINQFDSKGLNPDFNTVEDVASAVKETFSRIDKNLVEEMHFYGSGCSSPSRNKIISDGILMVFPNTKINIYHDLLGAARATSGNEKGIIGILGTGSNCCFYDGENITKEHRSGGYVIGDEGGGVDLGKRLIKAFIEDRMPQDLRERFNKRYELDVDAILFNLYKKPYPNKFLASFSQFVFHHREHYFISELIVKSFEAYFDQQVMRYHEETAAPLSIVGSIAFYYQEYIRKVAEKKGVTIGTLMEKPIAGLTLYHKG